MGFVGLRDEKNSKGYAGLSIPPKKKGKKKPQSSYLSRAYQDIHSFFSSIPKIPFAAGHIIKAQRKYRKTHPEGKEWQALFRGDIKRAFPKGAPATEALKEFTVRTAGRTAARAIPGSLEKHIGLKPRSILKDYGKNPILAPMEDISNLLMLSGAAKLTGVSKTLQATKAGQTLRAGKKAVFRPVRSELNKALLGARKKLAEEQFAKQGVAGLEKGMGPQRVGFAKEKLAKGIDYYILRGKRREAATKFEQAQTKSTEAIRGIQTAKLQTALEKMPEHEREIFVDYLQLQQTHAFEPVKKSEAFKEALKSYKKIEHTQRKNFIRKRLSTHEITGMIDEMPEKYRNYFKFLTKETTRQEKIRPIEHQMGLFSEKDRLGLNPLPSSKKLNIQRAMEIKHLDNQKRLLSKTQKEVDELTKLIKKKPKEADIKALTDKKIFLEKEKTKTLEMIAEDRRYKPLNRLTGRSIKELKELGIDPLYVRHFTEKYLSPKGTYVKTRPVGRARPGYMKKSKGIPGEIKEPEILTRARIEQVMTRITDDFSKDIGRIFGKTPPDKAIFPSKGKNYFIDKNGIPYVEFKYQLEKEMKGRKVERTFIPETFAKNYEKFSSSDEIMNLMNASQAPFTKLWRLSVLSLSPRWVFNNFVGNILLNTMAGVKPSSYVKSIRALRSPAYAQKIGLKAKDIKAIQAGAPYSSELMASRGKFTKGVEIAGKPLTYLNEKIEKWARVSHYISKRGEGFSKTKAIKSVNEFLFDYLKLSPYERSHVRRVVPFYTWTKNITRLAATYPAKHPYKAAVLNKLNLVLSEPQKELKKREFERFEIPVGKDKEGKTLMLGLRGANPLSDVLPLFEPQALNKLHPFLKVALEQLVGVDLLRGKQYQGAYPRVTESGEEIIPRPPLGRHILSQFPQYQAAEDLARPEARYFATNEPILTKEGKPIYTKPRSTVIGSLMGVKIQPRDLKAMEESKKRKKKYAKSWEKGYKKRLKKFQSKRSKSDSGEIKDIKLKGFTGLR